MPKHDGPARSHSGERYPFGKVPREVMRRLATSTIRQVVKKRATRKTRYHKIADE